MHAILISEENMEQIILDVSNLTNDDVDFLETCIGKNRFMVTGFDSPKGPDWSDWMFFPEFHLKKFEYDPVKIQTDWDQIVRK